MDLKKYESDWDTLVSFSTRNSDSSNLTAGRYIDFLKAIEYKRMQMKRLDVSNRGKLEIQISLALEWLIPKYKILVRLNSEQYLCEWLDYLDDIKKKSLATTCNETEKELYNIENSVCDRVVTDFFDAARDILRTSNNLMILWPVYCALADYLQRTPCESLTYTTLVDELLAPNGKKPKDMYYLFTMLSHRLGNCDEMNAIRDKLRESFNQPVKIELITTNADAARQSLSVGPFGHSVLSCQGAENKRNEDDLDVNYFCKSVESILSDHFSFEIKDEISRKNIIDLICRKKHLCLLNMAVCSRKDKRIGDSVVTAIGTMFDSGEFFLYSPSYIKALAYNFSTIGVSPSDAIKKLIVILNHFEEVRQKDPEFCSKICIFFTEAIGSLINAASGHPECIVSLASVIIQTDKMLSKYLTYDHQWLSKQEGAFGILKRSIECEFSRTVQSFEFETTMSACVLMLKSFRERDEEYFYKMFPKIIDAKMNSVKRTDSNDNVAIFRNMFKLFNEVIPIKCLDNGQVCDEFVFFVNSCLNSSHFLEYGNLQTRNEFLFALDEILSKFFPKNNEKNKENVTLENDETNKDTIALKNDGENKKNVALKNDEENKENVALENDGANKETVALKNDGKNKEDVILKHDEKNKKPFAVPTCGIGLSGILSNYGIKNSLHYGDFDRRLFPYKLTMLAKEEPFDHSARQFWEKFNSLGKEPNAECVVQLNEMFRKCLMQTEFPSKKIDCVFFLAKVIEIQCAQKYSEFGCDNVNDEKSFVESYEKLFNEIKKMKELPEEYFLLGFYLSSPQKRELDQVLTNTLEKLIGELNHKSDVRRFEERQKKVLSVNENSERKLFLEYLNAKDDVYKSQCEIDKINVALRSLREYQTHCSLFELEELFMRQKRLIHRDEELTSLIKSEEIPPERTEQINAEKEQIQAKLSGIERKIDEIGKNDKDEATRVINEKRKYLQKKKVEDTVRRLNGIDQEVCIIKRTSRAFEDKIVEYKEHLKRLETIAKQKSSNWNLNDIGFSLVQEKKEGKNISCQQILDECDNLFSTLSRELLYLDGKIKITDQQLLPDGCANVEQAGIFLRRYHNNVTSLITDSKKCPLSAKTDKPVENSKNCSLSVEPSKLVENSDIRLLSTKLYEVFKAMEYCEVQRDEGSNFKEKMTLLFGQLEAEINTKKELTIIEENLKGQIAEFKNKPDDVYNIVCKILNQRNADWKDISKEVLSIFDSMEKAYIGKRVISELTVKQQWILDACGGMVLLGQQESEKGNSVNDKEFVMTFSSFYELGQLLNSIKSFEECKYSELVNSAVKSAQDTFDNIEKRHHSVNMHTDYKYYYDDKLYVSLNDKLYETANHAKAVVEKMTSKLPVTVASETLTLLNKFSEKNKEVTLSVICKVDKHFRELETALKKFTAGLRAEEHIQDVAEFSAIATLFRKDICTCVKKTVVERQNSDELEIVQMKKTFSDRCAELRKNMSIIHDELSKCLTLIAKDMFIPYSNVKNKFMYYDEQLKKVEKMILLPSMSHADAMACKSKLLIVENFVEEIKSSGILHEEALNYNEPAICDAIKRIEQKIKDEETLLSEHKRKNENLEAQLYTERKAQIEEMTRIFCCSEGEKNELVKQIFNAASPNESDRFVKMHQNLNSIHRLTTFELTTNNLPDEHSEPKKMLNDITDSLNASSLHEERDVGDIAEQEYFLLNVKKTVKQICEFEQEACENGLNGSLDEYETNVKCQIESISVARDDIDNYLRNLSAAKFDGVNDSYLTLCRIKEQLQNNSNKLTQMLKKIDELRKEKKEVDEAVEKVLCCYPNVFSNEISKYTSCFTSNVEYYEKKSSFLVSREEATSELIARSERCKELDDKVKSTSGISSLAPENFVPKCLPTLNFTGEELQTYAKAYYNAIENERNNSILANDPFAVIKMMCCQSNAMTRYALESLLATVKGFADNHYTLKEPKKFESIIFDEEKKNVDNNLYDAQAMEKGQLLFLMNNKHKCGSVSDGRVKEFCQNIAHERFLLIDEMKENERSFGEQVKGVNASLDLLDKLTQIVCDSNVLEELGKKNIYCLKEASKRLNKQIENFLAENGDKITQYIRQSTEISPEILSNIRYMVEKIENRYDKIAGCTKDEMVSQPTGSATKELIAGTVNNSTPTIDKYQEFLDKIYVAFDSTSEIPGVTSAKNILEKYYKSWLFVLEGSDAIHRQFVSNYGPEYGKRHEDDITHLEGSLFHYQLFCQSHVVNSNSESTDLPFDSEIRTMKRYMKESGHEKVNEIIELMEQCKSIILKMRELIALPPEEYYYPVELTGEDARKFKTYLAELACARNKMNNFGCIGVSSTNRAIADASAKEHKSVTDLNNLSNSLDACSKIGCKPYEIAQFLELLKSLYYSKSINFENSSYKNVVNQNFGNTTASTRLKNNVLNFFKKEFIDSVINRVTSTFNIDDGEASMFDKIKSAIKQTETTYEPFFILFSKAFGLYGENITESISKIRAKIFDFDNFKAPCEKYFAACRLTMSCWTEVLKMKPADALTKLDKLKNEVISLREANEDDSSVDGNESLGNAAKKRIFSSMSSLFESGFRSIFQEIDEKKNVFAEKIQIESIFYGSEKAHQNDGKFWIKRVDGDSTCQIYSVEGLNDNLRLLNVAESNEGILYPIVEKIRNYLLLDYRISLVIQNEHFLKLDVRQQIDAIKNLVREICNEEISNMPKEELKSIFELFNTSSSGCVQKFFAMLCLDEGSSYDEVIEFYNANLKGKWSDEFLLDREDINNSVKRLIYYTFNPNEHLGTKIKVDVIDFYKMNEYQTMTLLGRYRRDPASLRELLFPGGVNAKEIRRLTEHLYYYTYWHKKTFLKMLPDDIVQSINDVFPSICFDKLKEEFEKPGCDDSAVTRVLNQLTDEQCRELFDLAEKNKQLLFCLIFCHRGYRIPEMYLGGTTDERHVGILCYMSDEFKKRREHLINLYKEQAPVFFSGSYNLFEKERVLHRMTPLMKYEVFKEHPMLYFELLKSLEHSRQLIIPDKRKEMFALYEDIYAAENEKTKEVFEALGKLLSECKNPDDLRNVMMYCPFDNLLKHSCAYVNEKNKLFALSFEYGHEDLQSCFKNMPEDTNKFFEHAQREFKTLYSTEQYDKAYEYLARFNYSARVAIVMNDVEVLKNVCFYGPETNRFSRLIPWRVIEFSVRHGFTTRVVPAPPRNDVVLQKPNSGVIPPPAPPPVPVNYESQIQNGVNLSGPLYVLSLNNRDCRGVEKLAESISNGRDELYVTCRKNDDDTYIELQTNMNATSIVVKQLADKLEATSFSNEKAPTLLQKLPEKANAVLDEISPSFLPLFLSVISLRPSYHNLSFRIIMQLFERGKTIDNPNVYLRMFDHLMNYIRNVNVKDSMNFAAILNSYSDGKFESFFNEVSKNNFDSTLIPYKSREIFLETIKSKFCECCLNTAKPENGEKFLNSVDPRLIPLIVDSLFVRNEYVRGSDKITPAEERNIEMAGFHMLESRNEYLLLKMHECGGITSEIAKKIADYILTLYIQPFCKHPKYVELFAHLNSVFHRKDKSNSMYEIFRNITNKIDISNFITQLDGMKDKFVKSGGLYTVDTFASHLNEASHSAKIEFIYHVLTQTKDLPGISSGNKQKIEEYIPVLSKALSIRQQNIENKRLQEIEDTNEIEQLIAQTGTGDTVAIRQLVDKYSNGNPILNGILNKNARLQQRILLVVAAELADELLQYCDEPKLPEKNFKVMCAIKERLATTKLNGVEKTRLTNIATFAVSCFLSRIPCYSAEETKFMVRGGKFRTQKMLMTFKGIKTEDGYIRYDSLKRALPMLAYFEKCGIIDERVNEDYSNMFREGLERVEQKAEYDKILTSHYEKLQQYEIGKRGELTAKEKAEYEQLSDNPRTIPITCIKGLQLNELLSHCPYGTPYYEFAVQQMFALSPSESFVSKVKSLFSTIPYGLIIDAREDENKKAQAALLEKTNEPNNADVPVDEKANQDKISEENKKLKQQLEKEEEDRVREEAKKKFEELEKETEKLIPGFSSERLRILAEQRVQAKANSLLDPNKIPLPIVENETTISIKESVSKVLPQEDVEIKVEHVPGSDDASSSDVESKNDSGIEKVMPKTSNKNDNVINTESALNSSEIPLLTVEDETNNLTKQPALDNSTRQNNKKSAGAAPENNEAPSDVAKNETNLATEKLPPESSTQQNNKIEGEIVSASVETPLVITENEVVPKIEEITTEIPIQPSTETTAGIVSESGDASLATSENKTELGVKKPESEIHTGQDTEVTGKVLSVNSEVPLVTTKNEMSVKNKEILPEVSNEQTTGVSATVSPESGDVSSITSESETAHEIEEIEPEVQAHQTIETETEVLSTNDDIPLISTEDETISKINEQPSDVSNQQGVEVGTESTSENDEILSNVTEYGVNSGETEELTPKIVAQQSNVTASENTSKNEEPPSITIENKIKTDVEQIESGKPKEEDDNIKDVANGHTSENTVKERKSTTSATTSVDLEDHSNELLQGPNLSETLPEVKKILQGGFMVGGLEDTKKTLVGLTGRLEDVKKTLQHEVVTEKLDDVKKILRHEIVTEKLEDPKKILQNEVIVGELEETKKYLQKEAPGPSTAPLPPCFESESDGVSAKISSTLGELVDAQNTEVKKVEIDGKEIEIELLTDESAHNISAHLETSVKENLDQGIEVLAQIIESNAAKIESINSIELKRILKNAFGSSDGTSKKAADVKKSLGKIVALQQQASKTNDPNKRAALSGEIMLQLQSMKDTLGGWDKLYIFILKILEFIVGSKKETDKKIDEQKAVLEKLVGEVSQLKNQGAPQVHLHLHIGKHEVNGDRIKDNLASLNKELNKHNVNISGNGVSFKQPSMMNDPDRNKEASERIMSPGANPVV